MNWYEFYRTRVNSDYQTYFEKRYKPFLDFIISFNPAVVIDAGCGIGSLSKFLISKRIDCLGFDIDSKMVDLARQNVKKGAFYQCDILHPNEQMIMWNNDLVVTHGVLEHFTDVEIRDILKLWPNSIHYVPLDKYHEPSFGDERLLPKRHWLGLVDPEYSFTFNNEHDLCFKK